uniref:uncharacterized protein LOC122589282 n=1 Tax=Erigeron canadensis TaxID=72917 RepID=UPI001CB9B167|nr:uncharacterized protein LOC122589282 [Erigeron canadensis]XP_043617492.1 uncharacterized protein LOC122589282 [Erigeron canadensis]
MESRKQISGNSSSSFTDTLFGPKDNRTSSSQFGSYFGPNSNVSSAKQDFGSPKHSTTDWKTQRSNGEKAEPSYLSSSIYYGGQEIYPPNTHTNAYPQHTLKKGGGGEDPNGSSASRGNWWQGSLYY